MPFTPTSDKRRYSELENPPAASSTSNFLFVTLISRLVPLSNTIFKTFGLRASQSIDLTGGTVVVTALLPPPLLSKDDDDEADNDNPISLNARSAIT
eukprot:CAMPEP_0172506548 /NCGR_PEP_ID=MMETSP1066-20121228/196023_1 /TAXON_ID=671091 /ORGANISM="Coscinodiscus wailesii, Strain CCMP2513" /LENGTH=96 /DNA_ID=CAMNT_0013283619 /DNA_START=88 /DNA_END=375 /DNA_ORIENTATION=+